MKPRIHPRVFVAGGSFMFKKRVFQVAAAAAVCFVLFACTKTQGPDYPIKDVPMTAVKFTDGFWAERQKTDIAVTIRHEMKESEETGRIKNFELAAAALKGATGRKVRDGLSPSTTPTSTRSSRPPPMP